MPVTAAINTQQSQSNSTEQRQQQHGATAQVPAEQETTVALCSAAPVRQKFTGQQSLNDQVRAALLD